MSRRQAGLEAFDGDGAESVVLADRDDVDVYHRPLAAAGDAAGLMRCRPQAPRGTRLSRAAAEARGLTACRKCWPSDDPAENGYVPPSPQDQPRHGRAGKCVGNCCNDSGEP